MWFRRKQEILPASLRACLTKEDAQSPAIELRPAVKKEGKEPADWAIATEHELLLATETEVVTRLPWHEVQYAKFVGEESQLSLHFLDPARATLVLHTVEQDPQQFMDAVTAGVNCCVLTTVVRDLPSGARAAASVRRDENDQLFSVLVVYGNDQPEDETALDALEVEVLESLGIDR